jgi:hypothetical protein
MISQDPQSNYKSSADIHLLKIGIQATHIFNSRRFSYRAANFQSELQSKTAGSFLVRTEPFYRELGMSGSDLSNSTRNVKDVFGNQTGLEYGTSIGLVLMPGYGLNMIIHKGKFYTCPIVMLGPGFSYNSYDGETGKYDSYNLEANGMLMFNSGYNGTRMYVNLRASGDICYSYYNPTIFSTTEVKIYLTIGFRFRNLEKVIPTSLL